MSQEWEFKMAWYFVMIMHLEKRKGKKRGGGEEEGEDQLPDAIHQGENLGAEIKTRVWWLSVRGS